MAIGLQELGIRQPNAELIVARVDENLVGDLALLEGKTGLTYVKNGAGDYTLTLENGNAKRTIVVLGVVPVTATLIPNITAVTTGAVQIGITNAAGVATASDFHIALLVFHHTTEY